MALDCPFIAMAPTGRIVETSLGFGFGNPVWVFGNFETNRKVGGLGFVFVGSFWQFRDKGKGPIREG